MLGSLALPQSRCADASGCSLNGRCVDGVCVCKPWWTGVACTELRLVPVTSMRSGVHMESTSTWGGSALLVDGVVHAYVAEMTNKCGVTSWEHNSRCVHLTASSPLGPYVRRSVVAGVWCHNPRITRTAGGKWLLYSIGHGVVYKEPFTKCARGVTKQRVDAEGPLPPDTFTRVLSAPGPHGPWTEHRVPTFTSASEPAPHLDNPAPLPPHSLAALATQARLASLAGRKAQVSRPFMVMFAARRERSRNSFGGCPHADCSQLGIARAARWDRPYVIDARPVCATVDPLCRNGSTPDWRTFCEDPFVWRDVDGSYHQLCNSKDCWEKTKLKGKKGRKGPPPPGPYPYFCNGFGMHAFSLDGVSWTWSAAPAYNRSVRMAGGGVTTLSRRERPHLLFDAAGVATHLVSLPMSPHVSPYLANTPRERRPPCNSHAAA